MLVSLCNKVAGVAYNFLKIKAPTRLFSCEICEIFKNTFFLRTPLVVAFEPFTIIAVKLYHRCLIGS